MVVFFTAAYDMYYKHFYSASESSRRLALKRESDSGDWIDSLQRAVGVSKKSIHKVEFGHVLREAIRFKHFCDHTPLSEPQEIKTCLTALQFFTWFLKPPEQIAVEDTSFTRLYEQNAEFKKQWLFALISIVDYVGPLNDGTVTRIATGTLEQKDALWLNEYNIRAIFAKLTAAKTEAGAQILSVYNANRVAMSNAIRGPRSQLDTGHVLHCMRAVLDASSKF